MPRLVSGNRGSGKPAARTARVAAGASGVVFTAARLLGSTSTLSLLAGTNANLTLNAATGAISAASAIANGVNQVAMVREAAGLLAIEYPVTVSGQTVVTPSPTPTPTPTPAWYDADAAYDIDFANNRAYAADGTSYTPADLFTGLPTATAGRGVFLSDADMAAFGPVLTQMMRGSQGTLVVETTGVPGRNNQRIIGGGGDGTGQSLDYYAILAVTDQDTLVSYNLSSTAGPIKSGAGKAAWAGRCLSGVTWSGSGVGGSARKICFNGGSLAAHSTVGVGNPTTFYLGRSGMFTSTGSRPLDGYISRIRFFPTNMADAAFQAKTTVPDLPVIANMTTPLMIFDTDMASDFDDAGALKLAVNLHKAGECTIIAAVTSSRNDYSAPCTKAMLDWSGLTTVPVGAYKGNLGSSNSAFAEYVTNNFGQAGKTRADFPDSVPVLRAALAAAPDGSVVYNCVGGLANLGDLLASPADGISPLTGVQLVAKKVNRVIQQGGREVRATGDFNLAEQPASSAAVFATCPVPIHFIAAWPSDIKTGLPNGDGTLDPYRYAYGPNGNTRESWDPVATLYAVRGVGAHFAHNAVNGKLNYVEATRFSEFDPTIAGRDTMVFRARNVTNNAMRDTLNAIMAIDAKAAA